MADQALVKRAVVLSLGEMERYPTSIDRYAATLPFSEFFDCGSCRSYNHPDDDNCPSTPAIELARMRAQCIKRTEERWTWFSSARKRDDECGEQLGTLINFPMEIREVILGFLFCDNPDYGNGQVIVEMDGDGPDPYCNDGEVMIIMSGDGGDHRTAGIPYPPNDGFCYNMRLASPSTKFDFEHYYLTKTNFIFHEPKALEAFLDRLSVYQRSLLRSVTLKLFQTILEVSIIREWVTVCARLPCNLVSVKFSPDTTCEGSVTKGQISLLEILGKRVRRLAARAKIGLLDGFAPSFSRWDGDDYGPPQDRETGVDVLKELEPWSKNWLEWREEAIKCYKCDKHIP